MSPIIIAASAALYGLTVLAVAAAAYIVMRIFTDY